MTRPHPDDVRSVMDANRNRLLGTIAAIAEITNKIDMERPKP